MRNLFTNEQIQKSLFRLNKCLPDKDVKNGLLFQPLCNTTISQDFSRQSLKRINVTKCDFVDCKFNGSAATGAKFSDTLFHNCDFSGSNFQYCFFIRVRFACSSIIKGANFSHSVFIECKFDNIEIIESTLFDCFFENCDFFDSIIKTNTMENSTICNCLVQNVDLAHINLEYMKFDRVKMKNVTLPPYQIPFIIGAPTYLKNSDDEIYIYSDNGNITRNMYSNMYNDLAIYFYNQKNYFPLANLYIAEENYADAIECIKFGIEEACDYFDFRMIKHYCRLACSIKEITHKQLKDLFDTITNLSYNSSWDLNILHSYMLNIGEIREILLNNSEDRYCAEIVIKTNIDKDDLQSINSLYNQVNMIIKEKCSCSNINSVELRHNSPYELYITCIDALSNVLVLLSTMYGLFTVGNKTLDFIRKIQETIGGHQQNKLSKIEIELKEEELKQAKIDTELKKSELMKVSKQTNIIIPSVVEMEHILKCSSIDDAKKFAPEYLHFKVSNTPE